MEKNDFRSKKSLLPWIKATCNRKRRKYRIQCCFTMKNPSSQCIVHHIDIELCTAEQPLSICSSFCNLSCNHTQKFSAGHRCFWQWGPVGFPAAWLLSFPAPFTRAWEIRAWSRRLCPAITSLIDCPLDVLYKGCFRRWNVFDRPAFLRKEVFPGLIDVF